eukprot:13981040-Heterocapsa_arctica.AAC.1
MEQEEALADAEVEARGAELQPAEEGGEARSKRGRDPCQEVLAEEELAARGAGQDARLVTAIGQMGPPWFDDYTGLDLDPVRA